MGAAVRSLTAVAALGLMAVSGASAARPTTVGAGSILRLTGTDIYCTVVKSGKTVTIACFHLPTGSASHKPKGWVIFGTDTYVGVTPPGTNRPKKVLPEPSFAGEPVISGPISGSKLLQIGVGDLAPVHGTHMGIYVSKAKGGGSAIGIVYLGPKDGPVAGEITAGISNHAVTLVRVASPTSSSVIYRHAVY